ncbi:hypothetical protein FUA23_13980 [Neolewinella aurantiaca]|uniref:DM13 domain-containing protein n=1 Tax=Neolewinella aurantiaca TaxID=2602767 RepID=A0A5C7FE83_9BACT|nr:Ig-like domain-containing protein [Neolewinella aurantiaca]TXF88572.1 hypothetical protein FUA23_13980 [Neolewinella aurantiaca]
MKFLLSLLPVILFTACIGEDIVDDYVQPVIRIQNIASSIEQGTSHQFGQQFINNVGQMEEVAGNWSSADPEILSISETGLATGLAEGQTTITLSYTDEFGETASASEAVEVGPSTVIIEEPMMKSGTVSTTSSYDLTGQFTLSEIPDSEDLQLTFGGDYIADDGLPGLYVYLSNNPNSSSGALEIGAVQVFSGAHEYTISGADLESYAYVLYFCKPFNVKVGHGAIE